MSRQGPRQCGEYERICQIHRMIDPAHLRRQSQAHRGYAALIP